MKIVAHIRQHYDFLKLKEKVEEVLIEYDLYRCTKSKTYKLYRLL